MKIKNKFVSGEERSARQYVLQHINPETPFDREHFEAELKKIGSQRFLSRTLYSFLEISEQWMSDIAFTKPDLSNAIRHDIESLIGDMYRGFVEDQYTKGELLLNSMTSIKHLRRLAENLRNGTDRETLETRAQELEKAQRT